MLVHAPFICVAVCNTLALSSIQEHLWETHLEHRQSFASRLCFSVNSRDWHRAKAKSAFLCCHVYEQRISFSTRTRTHKRLVKISVGTSVAFPANAYLLYSGQVRKFAVMALTDRTTREYIDHAPISCTTGCNNCLCDGYTRKKLKSISYQAAEPSRFCAGSVPVA